MVLINDPKSKLPALFSGGTDRAVIFDLDGTLADTAAATIIAFKETAPRFSLPTPTLEAIRDTTGYATPEFYYILFAGHDRETVDRMGEAVEELETASLRAVGEGILFPGVLDMLCSLDAAGVEMHIASTGTVPHVDAILDSSGIRRFFKSVSCGLPDKEEMTSGIIGRHPGRRWFFVGDKQKDINAATHSGIPCIGAGFGYVRPADRHLFTSIAESPKDILAAAGVQGLLHD